MHKRGVVIYVGKARIIYCARPKRPCHARRRTQRLLDRNSVTLRNVRNRISFQGLTVRQLTGRTHGRTSALTPMSRHASRVVELRRRSFPIVSCRIRLGKKLAGRVTRTVSVGCNVGCNITPGTKRKNMKHVLTSSGRICSCFGRMGKVPFLYNMRNRKHG